MDSTKQPGFSPAQKVYRPSPKRYLKFENLTAAFPVVVFSFFIVWITIFDKLPGLIISLIFIGPLDAFFVSYFLWRTHVRLMTSDEGIAYSTGGFRIFTPWGNVAGFGRRQELFQSPSGADYLGPTRSWTRGTSGLELQQPAPVYKASFLVRLFLRLHRVERPSFFIPISNVVEHWLDSEVAADIQRYAPQVALKMHLLRGASSLDDRRPRQRRDVEELIAALTAPDDEIRKSAARALGESKDAHAIDPLIAALQDPVHGVREGAVVALGKIGDARAVEPLLQELGTDLDLIAIAALQSVLVRIGEAQAVEFLRAFQYKLAEGDPRRGTVALLLVQVQSSR